MRKLIPTILETKQLPPFRYLDIDKIIVPISAGDFEMAVKDITSAKAIGFDTESKPVFKKGATNHGPHIVQFSTEHKAYIFQLNNPESYNPLLYLLSNENIKKFGFYLASDRKLLLKKFGVLPHGVIDLCPIFRMKGYRSTVGLRAAVAITLNEQFQKSKHTTMSNWDSSILSDEQLTYAANDAFAALRVYFSLSDDAGVVALINKG